jgi:adenosylhomocysteine nucleosidase
MTRVAIIAAMPGELKLLVRGWAHERRGKVDLWRWKFDEGEWVAVCGGAGVNAATRAFAEVEKDAPPDMAISVGWAGALTSDLDLGRTYNVSRVVDLRTGERFEAGSHPSDKNKDVARVGHPGLLLVTSPIVANGPEKLRLAAAYKADLVDMEAAAIARLAQMRGIPFYCIKGVSDGFHDKLPDFNRFIRPDGQFDMAGMVLFSILRPWHWPSLVRMGENSRKASQNIRDSLLDFLDGRGDIRDRNGYPNHKH